MLRQRIAKLEAALPALMERERHCDACHNGSVLWMVIVALIGGQRQRGGTEFGPYDNTGRCPDCGQKAKHEIHLVRSSLRSNPSC